jgi:hypothetical protein
VAQGTQLGAGRQTKPKLLIYKKFTAVVPSLYHAEKVIFGGVLLGYYLGTKWDQSL